MLVLSRRRDEEIVLQLPDGEQISIRMIRAHEGRARLGIEAPETVRIHRREVLERPPLAAEPAAA